MKKESVECAKEAFAFMDQAWFDDKDYPDYAINTLEDGEIIELGNREVCVIAIGAHNEGSIAFLDRRTDDYIALDGELIAGTAEIAENTGWHQLCIWSPKIHNKLRVFFIFNFKI